MLDKLLATKMAVQEHQIKNVEVRLEKIESELHKINQWVSIRRSELDAVEKATSKTAQRLTIAAMFMAAIASAISIFYKGPTQ